VCMKGKFLALGGIVVVLIVVGVFAGVYLSTYNNLVQLGESTDAQWAQIDTQLQRRYDLIPSVVNVSRAYINYEGSVLEEITRLRTQWAQAVQNGNVDEINNATGRLESSLSNLIVTFEAYPNLKASQVVQDLTVVLEGTENRIATERTRYNDAAKDYNIAIKAFPGNLFASGWGFEGRAYFQAKVGATEPPPVL
jgi:LemA protein